MIYEMMAEPPKPGTPLESLMLLVWRARQDIKMQETRAVVQATLAAGAEGEQKYMEQVWQDYLDEMYPFLRGRKKKGDEAAMTYFKKVSDEGPLYVKPLAPLTQVRSKLRTRYIKREEE
jgi:hypothetical protein